eukprot:TRINITY_DN1759_c0_g1_i2.p2 TRINITY_DN1759_c0_g1~~TRINITY_DN1759_c0_g1_i2.p2  ORF type:complete len:129 (-),score=24.13 TRINITY_DN1759_c0_g1_i2:8-394(-)
MFHQVMVGDDIILPMLRRLETDKKKTNESNNSSETIDKIRNNVPYLECPILIQDLAASIITHCQLNNIMSTAFLSVEDHRILGVSTVTAWEDIIPIITGTSPPSSSHLIEYNNILKTCLLRKPNSMFL